MFTKKQSMDPTTSRSPILNKSADKLKYQSRRTMGGKDTGHQQGVEKSKLTDARDYIYKILGVRMESQYNPFNYEYLDLSQPLPDKNAPKRQVSMIIDDIYWSLI